MVAVVPLYPSELDSGLLKKIVDLFPQFNILQPASVTAAFFPVTLFPLRKPLHAAANDVLGIAKNNDRPAIHVEVFFGNVLQTFDGTCHFCLVVGAPRDASVASVSGFAFSERPATPAGVRREAASVTEERDCVLRNLAWL